MVPLPAEVKQYLQTSIWSTSYILSLLIDLSYKRLIFCDNMEIRCSLKSFAGVTCGFSYREDRSCISRVVPLRSCQEDISSHLRSRKFSNPENEVDFILSSAGIFETRKDITDFTICPTSMFSSQLNDAHLFYSLPSTEVKQLNRCFCHAACGCVFKNDARTIFFSCGHSRVYERTVN